MSAATDPLTIQYLSLALYLFFTLFICLIGFVLIHRYLLSRWENKVERSAEKMRPYLYSYIDGEIKRKDFADLLEDKFDIAASFRSIRLMLETLSGEQKTRLKSLLDIPAYKKYFLKRLRSSQKIQVAQACIYFEKKNLTDKSVISRLKELQYHSYSVIKYSATLALINATDQSVRDDALDKFMRQDGHSSMNVSDIIYKYVDLHPDKSNAGRQLLHMVFDSGYPADNSVPIVLLLPEFGMYGLIDQIYQRFNAPPEHDTTGRLTASIVEILGEYSTDDIGPLLEHNALWSSEYQPVRLAAAEWLQKNSRTDFYDELLKLSSDSDLEVRIAAQRALLHSGNKKSNGHDLDPQFKDEFYEIEKEMGVSDVNAG